MDLVTNLLACGEEAAAASNWADMSPAFAHMAPWPIPRFLCKEADTATTPAPSIAPKKVLCAIFGKILPRQTTARLQEG